MKKLLLFAVVLSNFLWLAPANAQTAPVIRPIAFPVVGAVTYYDDFGAARVGHTHEGNDLMGHKLMPLVAAVTGTVTSVNWPEATWGYSVTITDADGYTYHYLHMNNDIPGTDNDKGGGPYAYAPDIKRGQQILAGQLVGWMGDSGDAESTSAHLHFEIRQNGVAFSPFASLQAATHITTPTDYPAATGEILPYGNAQVGVSIAAANFDADSDVEVVTGAGPGGGPHVEVFDQGNSIPKSGFMAYDQFTGGVDVAAGDLDGDGISEIITAPGKTGGPNIRIFKADGTLVTGFMAYDPAFRGGVKVAAADLDGDGKSEIITAAGIGSEPIVKVFSAAGVLINQFNAYPGFTGGIDVGAFKAQGGSTSVIVTSPGTGGGPHVKAFDSIGTLKSEFMAYDPLHRGGVRVSVGTMNTSSAPVVFTAALLGGPDFRQFSLTGAQVANDTEFETWWSGSWDITGLNGKVFVATGPNTMRRASVRLIDFVAPSDGRFNNGNDNFYHGRNSD